MDLKALNNRRTPSYRKSEEDENFLNRLNDHLKGFESSNQEPKEIRFPFVFTFGIPRSGSTIISQFIAQHVEVEYFNNLAARFYKAPITGLKLSKLILGDQRKSQFHSDYAKTSDPSDIHEFGYFWRERLIKSNFQDYKDLVETEKAIDWDELKFVLSSIQSEFNAPFLFKNIYAAYHIKKFIDVLDEKVVFVYIKRNMIQNVLSLIEARKRINTNLDEWWSSVVPEYELLLDKPHLEQVVGQYYFLQKLYTNQFTQVNHKNIVQIEYDNLINNPEQVLNKILAGINRYTGHAINIRKKPSMSNFKAKDYSDTPKELISSIKGLYKKFEENFGIIDEDSKDINSN